MFFSVLNKKTGKLGLVDKVNHKCLILETDIKINNCKELSANFAREHHNSKLANQRARAHAMKD
ncbi:hypothetical protein BpHYR1_035884 [Brachionus plicatilis]|uniref:Uncharacterized protein n=1 Tax=Brachionus plicatilis TaxID=10195 RepID=A0A3M7QVA2_BRAPC|nr:hypothetical protein BpHYR1_035884 [Brachionus plicatilis]